MNKTLLLLPVVALVVAPLTAAEAASSYRVSAGVTHRTVDVSSPSASLRTSTIKGKVTGGPVKGKQVYLYVTNTDTASRTERYIGSDTLDSDGRFSRSYRFKDGGKFSVRVLKKAGSGRHADDDTTTVYAYRWTNLHRFFRPDASVLAARSEGGHDDDERVGSTYWRTQYGIDGSGVAYFATTGWRCKKINFKIGVAHGSAHDTGSFRVRQGSDSIVSKKTMDKDDTAYEPSKSTRDRMRADRDTEFSVDPWSAEDPTSVRFILGNPKAFCTYPSSSTPAQPAQ